MSARALAAVDRIIDQGGEADDVLRAVVAALADEPAIAWAGILFVEGGALALGPEAGAPDPPRRIQVPIAYEGDRVGELAVDGDADRATLERVALLVAAHVLLGWDTGGQPWEP